MRRLIARTAAVAAALAALTATVLLTAAPAAAGGPTSVLVVNYDGSRAAGALTGSRAYADLEEALQAYGVPSGEATAPGSFMGTQVRLTWLIHNVTPWRIDAISITGEDVWVETTMDTSGGQNLFDTPGVRHRAAHPELLLATLGSLGVIGETAPARSPGPSPTGVTRPTDAVAAVAAPKAVGTPEAEAVPAGVSGWAAAAAAVLALGLGVGLGIRLGLGLGRRNGRRASVVDSEATGSATAEADDDRVAPVGFTVDPGRATR